MYRQFAVTYLINTNRSLANHCNEMIGRAAWNKNPRISEDSRSARKSFVMKTEIQRPWLHAYAHRIRRRLN
jgi:hypothetical protein